MKEIKNNRPYKKNKWIHEGYIYLRPKDYMEIFEKKSHAGTAAIRPMAVNLKKLIETTLLKDILMGGKLGKEIQKMVSKGIPLDEAMKSVYDKVMELHWGVPNEEKEKLLEGRDQLIKDTWSKKKHQPYMM